MTTPTNVNLAMTLFALSSRFARLANNETDRLRFDDYATLQEWEVRLYAYASLHSAIPPDLQVWHELAEANSFLRRELTDAEACLAFLEQRLGVVT